MSSPLFSVDKTPSLGNWVTFHFNSALLLSSLCYCKQAPENNKPTTHFFPLYSDRLPNHSLKKKYKEFGHKILIVLILEG